MNSAAWYRVRRDEALAACREERRRANRAIRMLAARDKQIMDLTTEIGKLRPIVTNIKRTRSEHSQLQYWRRMTPIHTSRELG